MRQPRWMRSVARLTVIAVLAGLVPTLPLGSADVLAAAPPASSRAKPELLRAAHPGTVLTATEGKGNLMRLEAGTPIDKAWHGKVHVSSKRLAGTTGGAPTLLIDGRPFGTISSRGIDLDTISLSDGVHGLTLSVEGAPQETFRITVDNHPPMVESVEDESTHVPGEPVAISATVTDTVSDVTSVVAAVSDGSQVPLTRMADGRWRGTIPGATQDRTYDLVVIDAAGNKGSVQPKNGGVLPVAPLPAPERLIAEPGEEGIALHWESMALPEGARFTVLRGSQGKKPARIATVDGTTYTDKTAKPGETYTYAVAVTTSSGFTGPAVGEVEATASPQSDDMTLEAVTTLAAPSTSVGGSITGNVTWTQAGSPYVLTSTVTVQSGATLTIEPGVIVKLGSFMSLINKGQLQAVGQAGSPIIFTSVKDDAHGGDSNGDGTATTPAGGNWSYLQVDAGGTAVLQDVTVMYAITGVYANGGTVQMDQSQVQYASSRGVQLSGTSWLRNSTVSGVPNFSVYVSGGSPEISGNTVAAGSYGIYVAAGTPTISGNTIQGSSTTVGIQYAPTTVAGGSLINNAVTGVKYPADLGPSQGRLDGLTASGNSFTGNTYNGYGLGGSFGGTSTLPLLDYPYVMRGASVATGATLTIPAGTIIKALPNVYFTSSGTLIVDGTAQAPVTFTSIKDDSIGGDTNGNGAATAPAPGDWQYLSLAGGRLSHAVFRYSGQWRTSVLNLGSGTVDHIDVDDTSGSGVRFTAGTGTLTDSTISVSEDAVSISGGSITVEGNSLSGRRGVYLNGGSPVVRSNSITGSPTGIYVDYNTTAATLEGNTISGATNAGILLHAAGSELSGITMTGNVVTSSNYAVLVELTRAGLGTSDWSNNQFGSGNNYNGYGLTGNVAGNTALYPLDLPWVVPDLTVDAGSTLTVTPGSVLKFSSTSSGLLASGAINVRGTSAQPVILTSIVDDGADGKDTNGDGPSSGPQSGGLWDGIHFNSGGTADMEWTKVQYGDFTATGAVYFGTGTAGLTIANSEFAYNRSSGIYLISATGAAVSISSSQFHHNGKSGIYLNNGNTARISGNEFTDQPMGIRFLLGDQSQIIGNKFQRNTDGIYYAGYDPAKAPVITNNTFDGNTNSGVYSYLPYGTMDVSYNWWGTDQGPSPYGTGDALVGPAWYEPYIGQQYYQSRQYAGAWWSAKAGNVDLPTGDYSTSASDTGIEEGRGLPVQIGRTYHSSNRKQGLLGIGWTFSYELAVTEDASTGEATAFYGSGQQARFTRNADGTYSAPPGDLNRLTKGADGSWELMTKSRTIYQYRADGLLTRIIDRNGNETTLTYTGTRLDQITDATGRTFQLLYDAQGRLNEVVDPANRHVIYAYDSAGRLHQVTDVRSGVTTYMYDTKDRLTQVVDQTNRLMVLLTYDGNSRVATRENGVGNRVVFSYDLLQRKVTVTDSLGQTVTEYDPQLRVKAVTDANQKVTNYVYDDFNNIRTVQDAGGGISTYEYDSRQNLRFAADQLGNTTEYRYDTQDRVIEVIDPLQHSTTMAYDGSGNLLQTTDARLKVTSYTYYPGGLLHTVTDPLNHTTTYTYDAYGNMRTVQNPLLKTWVYVSDILGRVTEARDPYQHSTYWQRNAFGQVEEVRDTDFVWVEKRTYDAAGRPLTITDGMNGVTTYEYDAAGRLWKVTDSRNSTTINTYDGNGNLKAVVNQLTEKTQYEYDGLNRLVKVTLPDNVTVYQYAYNPMGRMIAVTDGRNHTRSYSYDLAGQLKSETDHMNRIWLYEYDRNGNRLSMTDPNHGVTAYTHDELNRVATVAAPGLSVAYQYDDAGNLAQMTDSTGTTVYEYNALDLLQRKTVPDGRWIGYEYDDASRLWKTNDFNGRVIERGYDSRNRLQSVTLPGSETTTYTYDGADRWATRTYPNGFSTRVGRDAAGLITLVENLRPDQTVLSSFSYIPDALGRYQQVTDAAGTTGYTYDVNGRLHTESLADGRLVTYEYDGAGNRTSKTVSGGGLVTPETTTYSYDNTDRLVSVTLPGGGAVSYTHDANGNMTGDGSRTYLYDGLNRLAEVQQGGTTLATYAYDGNGLRWSKTTAQGTVRYYYDGGLIANEGDGTAITASNVWGLDLLRRDAGGQTGYYLYNGHGDVASVLDPAGSELGAYRYDAFGQQLSAAGTIPNPFRYAGEPYDEETGFIYLRARYYDPSLGRFVSQDTYKGDPQRPSTQNLFTYGLNNPVSYVDPTGHFAFLIPLAWAGVAWLALNMTDTAELTMDAVDVAMNPGCGQCWAATGADLLSMALPGPQAPMDGPTSAKLKAANRGNQLHYDELNGGPGKALPTQLQEMFPETEFTFARRGQAGADVKVEPGSKHPSEYEDSPWTSPSNYGDFKPNTESGRKTYSRDVKKGKYPAGTQMIPYDPIKGNIESEW